LHSQDIDGDGRILQMRIPDPNGEWKVSSLDPRLLEKRAPDEHGGQYYRLFNEGLLEDYDGYLIKVSRPYQGLDFNRNYPSQWRPENEQAGAGPFPGSEPEIRAAIEFITSHPNINIAITYHTFSRVILRPYGTKPDDEMPTNDLWVFKKIGELGTALTGYRNVSTFHDFKYHPKEVITGVFDDWMYDTLGVFSFTVEQWDLPTEAGIEERKFMDWFRVHPHEEDLQILKWSDEKIGKDGYVDWYPFDHPQLGKVELGGWNFMYTWRNPPHSLIGAEAERNLPFALALGDMLPRLSLHTLEVKSLGNGECYLNLVVENSGFLPTCTSEQARNRKAGRTVRVELHLPEGVQLLSGRHKVDLDHLAGRSGRLDATMIWTSSPTDNRARCEWVLAGPSGAQIGVHVFSDRAGSLHTWVTLP
jgi:murein tripeptide amidase MpaA